MSRVLDRVLRSRRPRSRYHPTPDQALAALSEGRCMYGLLSKCSSPPKPTGLRHNEDTNDILVCKAHYGRLRHMPPAELDRLERALLEAYRPLRAVEW